MLHAKCASIGRLRLVRGRVPLFTELPRRVVLGNPHSPGPIALAPYCRTPP